MKRTYEEIAVIVASMEEDLFEKINEADDEMLFELDKRVARNAKRRLIYNLKKCDLTLEEWEEWTNF